MGWKRCSPMMNLQRGEAEEDEEEEKGKEEEVELVFSGRTGGRASRTHQLLRARPMKAIHHPILRPPQRT